MGWNTPQILKLSGAAVVFTALLLMLAVLAGARSHRHSVQVIGRDSAPSIVAAQQIGTALADMDAAAAEDDRQRFEARRVEAVSAIVTAAENITFGDAERAPIRKLALGIGTYAAAVQTAADKHQIEAWRQAENFMDTELLPAAAALERANREQLDKVWAAEKTDSATALAMVIVAGFLLGVVLVGMQIFLAKRMRRALNPGLLGATAAAWIFVVFAGQAFNSADRDLRVAKEDAFDSVIALWQARSLAYSANGDQSRALMDPANAAVHRKDFLEKDERIRQSIGNELNNITFAGEREAAEEMMAKHAEYTRMEQAGQHKQAVAAFREFDAAAEKTLKVNQAEFGQAVERGFRDVANFEVLAPLATLAICALAWLGLWPRLREYSA